MSTTSGVIKLTYENLRDRSFYQAVSKINTFNGFKDSRILVNIARVVKLIDKYQKECDEVFIKLVKQFCELDEKGEIKSPADRPGAYTILPEKLGEWKTALEDFHKIEVELFAKKIKLFDLTPAQLSAQDVVMLEPMLDGLTGDGDSK